HNSKDYVAADEYFRLLTEHSVKFYDTSADVEEPDSGYDHDDSEDEEMEEDEESSNGEDEESSNGEDVISQEDLENLM
ncbi:MAG TPA: hypothetical protein VK641_16470, partial [Terriglobales bacterium]|nr:hypothetical protein [Terriglobales bacterium]